MRTGGIDEATLRRLAAYESDEAPVLSLYLDLGGSAFALADARATAARSLIDEAHRRIEANQSLSHRARTLGLEAIERARDWLEGPAFSPQGAQAIAVFSAGGDGLFEVLKLPRPVPSEVIVGRKPFVEPLVDMTRGGGWCILLASREAARVFRGSIHRLDEVASIGEHPARGQHDQGGLSQARYERSVEKDAEDHLKQTAELLFRRFKRAPFDRLVLGMNPELAPRLEQRLHPDMRRRMVGRIDIDAEHSSADEVLAAARPIMDREDRLAEEEAIARLRERVSNGRAAAGLDDVLAALTERRVETLLLDDGLSATGSLCPRCGWLGPADVGACPADGTETERRDDIADLAIDRALAQSASVLVPRSAGGVSDLGGIAAILRF